MAMNDPKAIAHLLRCIANTPDAVYNNQDVILNTAARLLDPPASGLEPLFYVKHGAVFQRPVRSDEGIRMGFRVCEVCDGVDPVDVCIILNKGEPATEG